MATSTWFIPAKLTPSTPAAAMSAYRLRRWAENDSRVLANYVVNGQWQYPAGFGGMELTQYAMPFQYEYLLRYPASPNWEDIAWRAAGIVPQSDQVAGLKPGQDLFAYLCEELLNHDGVLVDALPDRLKSLGFIGVEIHKVMNLFGDGNEAWVVRVIAPGDIAAASLSAGTFAIHRIDDEYRLEVIKTWSVERYGGDELRDFPDSNANGIPEVLIIFTAGTRGMPPGCQQRFNLYEWHGNSFVALADNLEILSIQMIFGPCEGTWDFTPASSGSVPDLVLKEQLYTVHTMNDCPNLEIWHRYTWNGEQYVFDHDERVSSSSDQAACQVAWAYIDVTSQEYPQGWQDDRAIQILTNQLADWPAQADEKFGPASRDYFTLQLGIWRDLRREGDQALALLQPLAKQPTLVQYDLPSRLAARYLEGRKKGGVLGGCVQVNQAWDKAKSASTGSYGDGTYDPDKVRQEWGFTGPWTDYWGLIPKLCDQNSAFDVGIASLAPKGRDDLARWLAQAGIHWLNIQPADVNFDGVQDWLVSIDEGLIGNEKSAVLYAFVQNDNKWMAYGICSIIPYQEPLMVKWQALRPKIISHLFNLFLVDGNFVIMGSLDQRSVDDIFVDWNVSDYKIVDTQQGFSLTLNEQTQSGPLTLTYTWDSIQGKFVLHEDYDFDVVQKTAERLVFHDRDFQGAINFIEKFLVNAPAGWHGRNPSGGPVCDNPYCDSSPDWYHPYLRYLLGIAYELSGFPDQALRVYYELWRDYPNHLYGMVAALKLEPIGNHP